MFLKDKVSIVTGSGRGWGRSIARKLAQEGSLVYVVARTKSEIDETITIIQKDGGKARRYLLDVSDDRAVEGFIKQVEEESGRIDILVNNAAILPLKLFEDMSMDEVDRVLSINLRATMVTSKLVLNTMKRQGGGSIINVSSNAGIFGFEKESIYCASKHAIEGFSKSIALEYKPFNIAVNTITPGGVNMHVRIKPTSLTQSEFEKLPAQEKEKWTDSIISTEAFVFLAMQRGDGITGERFAAYEFSERIRKNGWEVKKEDLRFEKNVEGLC